MRAGLLAILSQQGTYKNWTLQGSAQGSLQEGAGVTFGQAENLSEPFLLKSEFEVLPELSLFVSPETYSQVYGTLSLGQGVLEENKKKVN